MNNLKSSHYYIVAFVVVIVLIIVVGCSYKGKTYLEDHFAYMFAGFYEPIINVQDSIAWLERTSTLTIDFQHNVYTDSCNHAGLNVSGTPSGAIAKRYQPHNWHGTCLELDIETQINQKEWLDFIKSVYNNAAKWGYQYSECLQMSGYIRYLDHDATFYDFKWSLKIYDTEDELAHFEGCNELPENWAEFKKVMDDMRAKIKESENEAQIRNE